MRAVTPRAKGAIFMSRSIKFQGGVSAAIVSVCVGFFGRANAAVDSASIVAGSLTQGTVKASLTGGSYANESANLGDWPLSTGGSAANTFAISFENADFNGNSFGGNANTMIAFGNGGGVTLKFATPITPHAGEKDLGIFTAQSIAGGSGSLFNGNMDAAILVSGDGNSWFTLTGAAVSSPMTYTGTTYGLNAPTMAYNYKTGATAWNYGAGTSAANLSALAIADFTTPMPDDSLFNGTGTNAQRLALTTDSSTSDYNAIFGTSGGGNWLDVSGSGLSSIDYVRLNGDANDPSTGGVRLDAVFANGNAVPEPATSTIVAIAGLIAMRRRKR
jgi:hypothetical protein